jgi:hypothetical protein
MKFYKYRLSRISLKTMTNLKNILNLIKLDLICRLDVKEAEKYLAQNPDSSYTKRVYAKSVISAVEASLFNLRQSALLLSEGLDLNLFGHNIAILKVENKTKFTLEEQCALREISAKLDDSGKVSSMPIFYPFKANFNFSLNAICRQLGDAIAVTKESGWSDLCQAVNIRNRITHPRDPALLELSDNEIGFFQRGWEWYQNLIEQVSDQLTTIIFHSIYRADESAMSDLKMAIEKIGAEKALMELEQLINDFRFLTEQSDDIKRIAKDNFPHEWEKSEQKIKLLVGSKKLSLLPATEELIMKQFGQPKSPGII